MITALELLGAFVLIIVGAIGFTNAVEWLGQRMNLGAGAVGSAHLYAGRREQGADVTGEPDSTRRDLHWYLALMPVGIVLGVVSSSDWLRYAGAALLIAGYAAYVRSTVKKGGDAEGEELDPLYFDTSKDDPPSTPQMTLQFVVSLAAIIAGAELFVSGVEHIAESAGISALVLALVLAPLATEMPEKAKRRARARRAAESSAPRSRLRRDGSGLAATSSGACSTPSAASR